MASTHPACRRLLEARRTGPLRDTREGGSVSNRILKVIYRATILCSKHDRPAVVRVPLAEWIHADLDHCLSFRIDGVPVMLCLTAKHICIHTADGTEDDMIAANADLCVADCREMIRDCIAAQLSEIEGLERLQRDLDGLQEEAA